jgi:hypothetical protein
MPAWTRAESGNLDAGLAANEVRLAHDEALVENVLKGAPPFARLRLAPGVNDKTYRPDWTSDGLFVGPDGTIYILCELPLPAGVAAGARMKSIGTLNMGNVHVLAKPSLGGWSLAGFAGSIPVVQDERIRTFAVRGRRLVPVDDHFAYTRAEDKPATCGTFGDGSTCEEGTASSGVVVYAKSNSVNKRHIVTQAALDAALHGHAELENVGAGVFNFAGRDYLSFKGAIFLIQGTSLQLIGPGTPLAYARHHVVITDPRATDSINEEETP